MPYSLLSRFQGCLLGSGLGEHWASQATDTAIDWNHLTWQSAEQFIPAPGNRQTAPRLNYPDLTSNGHRHPEFSQGGWAIATLPLMLFFHDDALKQQQALTQAIQPWQTETSTQASVLALGYAIAQACKQQLNPTTLLSEISAYLQLCIPPSAQQTTDSNTWVAATQALLAEATDLHTAITTVQQWQRQPNVAGAIGLAFYCFLTTPDTWQLTVQRAGRIEYSPLLVTTLTAALSGAHNSAIGIPSSWLTAYDHSRIAAVTLSTSQIRQLATRLLASWSGSYEVTAVEPLTAAVAAPQIIRPR